MAGVQYYYWVLGTNTSSGCQGEFGAGDGGAAPAGGESFAATFTRDRREMVRAAITANADTNDILVLYSTTGEVTGAPALNSGYSVGNTTRQCNSHLQGRGDELPRTRRGGGDHQPLQGLQRAEQCILFQRNHSDGIADRNQGLSRPG